MTVAQALLNTSSKWSTKAAAALGAIALTALPALAGATGVDAPVFQKPGGEANLVIPDLNKVKFLGIGGHDLLLVGFVVSLLGLVFGAIIYGQLKKMPVHKSMLEVSELIYSTCKSYMIQQGKFLARLFIFIGAITAIYFGLFAPTPTIDAATGEFKAGFSAGRVALILAFAVVGVLGSYLVAWYGIRVNTFANSRTAFASLKGKPFPCYALPLKAGMSIGMMLISVELMIMLAILLLLPADLAGACLIGFAIGESLGAAALRIAGGIFTKIADIGSDLMKIVFKIKEDDARNPGVIADCVGDNAGDSVGPSADGFETYGVTGVALIVFTMIAVTPSLFAPKQIDLGTAQAPRLVSYAYATSVVDVANTAEYQGALEKKIGKETDAATAQKLRDLQADTKNAAVVDAAKAAVLPAQEKAQTVQIKLLVWLFMMRIIMVIASALSYFINEAIAKAKYGSSKSMNFEHPLTVLVFLTSAVSIGLTYVVSYLMLGGEAAKAYNMNGDFWWMLATIISCGTAAGAIIPELVKAFTSVHSRHVREVVKSSEQGGPSLNILSGLVAGNFSAYWLGGAMIVLMAVAYSISTFDAFNVMLAPAVFAFGLVAFGFLSMGPVTIAVDSYGPVTDNAQSVFELSTIETTPGIKEEIKRDFGFEPDFEAGKQFLEENDGAGNTFKATAKPVLIGTAVVGATTMIFSIIVVLTGGLQANLEKLSLLHAPFLLGLITGGAVIYWFTGASIQAVTTGAYRAVEFIKANIKLEGSTKASVEDSQKVVTICTQYAQKGMFNIFLGVFFATLAFAFAEPFFFIGYLIAIALFGLYQAMFMANAGGAWDNAKKIVETDSEYKNSGRGKGSELHAATVVGDTVGDPFKDTSSVALNPVIKFTTLFGLLAVELAIHVKEPGFKHTPLTIGLAVAFLVASAFFVYRSFYGMQIDSGKKHSA
ncbi:MAG: sodium-translocating pyrophosphatase [Planctomycetota bacterium]|nr:sodium-translocating pyrophosphatase [Planctomycetota bacterium]